MGSVMDEEEPTTTRVPSGTADARARSGAGWPWFIATSVAILAAAFYPLVRAVLGSPRGHHFWGALWYSPDDSLLLSVMWEGVRGHWLHAPPYALADGPGAFIYPAYLLLGHVAAWTGLSPLSVFLLARLAAGVLLLLTLDGFVGRFFRQVHERRFAFLVAATGCGLGWLFVLVSRFRSAEFSTPEVYPLFSILAGFHVTLAIAALLWVLEALVPRGAGSTSPRRGWSASAARWGRLVAGVLVLATMQPFGCVVALCVGALWATARWRREARVPRLELASLLVVAGLSLPFVLHQLSTIASNPAYAGWHTQVRTPTPPFWQVLVAIGLPLPFALVGLVDSARRRQPDDLLLLFWTCSMAVLLSLPYYQARRFDLAGSVPLAILAVRGIGTLRFRWSAADRLLAVFLNALSSLVIIGAAASRVTALDPELFLKQDTWDAVCYLRDHAAERAVVLAEPVTSLAVVASSPLRIVFGHPAETPQAHETHEAVRAFFDRGRPLEERLMRRVDYILVEPRADGATTTRIPADFQGVLRSGGVTVYRRGSPRPGEVPAPRPF